MRSRRSARRSVSKPDDSEPASQNPARTMPSRWRTTRSGEAPPAVAGTSNPSGEGNSKGTAPDKIGVRHVIIVSPGRHRNKRAHPAVYDVRMQGQERIICSSRQPFLDAARVMLDGGLPISQDWLIMRRAGSGADCLSASVAEAAKLSVEERRDGRGPVFVPWKPFVSADLDAARERIDPNDCCRVVTLAATGRQCCVERSTAVRAISTDREEYLTSPIAAAVLAGLPG